MRRFLRPARFVLLFAAAFAIGWLPLPYYSAGPGPAREVVPLIHVSGHPQYPPQGRLVMTTVSFRHLTPLGALIAWIDPHTSIVPRSDLYPAGVTEEQDRQRSISEMDTSKIDATSVALSDVADYPAEHRPGALIESIVPGCPAEGKLFAGDLVGSINGQPIDSEKAAQKAIDGVPPDRPITFHVTAAGEAHAISLTRTDCVKSLNRPIVGITMIDDFPFPVTISSLDVGGPSAGLMWSLGLYDLLTPGDLTGGRTIAGTGTIDLQGKVGPIGGVEDKVYAAEKAGAQVFLVPRENYAGAKAASDGTMRLVPVSSYSQALDALAGSAAA